MASPVDALRDLFSEERLSCWISKAPSGIKMAPNGLEHFWVEVTRSDGAQFHISAFGNEARELYNESTGLGDTPPMKAVSRR